MSKKEIENYAELKIIDENTQSFNGLIFKKALTDIISTASVQFIRLFGRSTTAKFLKVSSFITKILTETIILYPICNF